MSMFASQAQAIAFALAAFVTFSSYQIIPNALDRMGHHRAERIKDMRRIWEHGRDWAGR